MSISRTSICFSHVSWCCSHPIGCEKCNNKYPKIELRDKVVRMKEKLRHNNLTEQAAANRQRYEDNNNTAILTHIIQNETILLSQQQRSAYKAKLSRQGVQRCQPMQ